MSSRYLYACGHSDSNRWRTFRTCSYPEALGRQGIQATNVNAGMMSVPQDLDLLAELVSVGDFEVPIAHGFALEEAPEALQWL